MNTRPPAVAVVVVAPDPVSMFCARFVKFFNGSRRTTEVPDPSRPFGPIPCSAAAARPPQSR